MTRLLTLLLVFFLLLPATDRIPADSFSFPTALADDDDDDGDDDSDDDNDDNGDDGGASNRGEGGSGGVPPRARRSDGNGGPGEFFAPLRRLFGSGTRENQPRQTQRRVVRPPVLFASGEIIVVDISSQDLETLLNDGYSVLEQRSVPGGRIFYRLAVPDNLPLDEARDAVRSLPSGGNTDYNHYYRSESSASCGGENCPAFQLVNWPAPDPESQSACVPAGSLGLIDTGINEKHAVFEGARLKVLRLTDESLPASKSSHGTAVASIIAGQPGTRVPGLLPNAQVIAIDAFHRAGRDERADAFTLVDALYNLASQNVIVINLSLAGPENSVVEAAIRDLSSVRNIAIVAAAGNGGPKSEPVFPAAYPGVLAVTAVDRNRRVYRRAVYGDYVDLAAPGVNVWAAASVRGAKWKTGTSYAVPFATAAVALARARYPEKTPDQIYDYLKSKAADLGKTGSDPVFGAGLLQTGGLC